MKPQLNTNEPAGDPPMMRYNNASGMLHQIFLPVGTYRRALYMLEAEDWDALSQFSLWSDQPALKSVQPVYDELTPTHAQRNEGRSSYLLVMRSAQGNC